MLDTGDIIYILFFFAIIIIIIIAAREYIVPFLSALAAAIRQSYNDKYEYITGKYEEFICGGDDNSGNSDEQIAQIDFIEGGDVAPQQNLNALKDYLNNNIIPTQSQHHPIDSKNLTIQKMKVAAKKQITFETFIDKLITNSIILIASLDVFPTDLAAATLKQYNNIINSAYSIIESKYPDSQITGADLRELHRKIETKIKSATNLNKISHLSRDELNIKYIQLLSNVGHSQPLDDCKKDLQLCENKKTLINEELQITKRAIERLREELSRGLTASNCDALLRDTINEKQRLENELRLIKSQNDPTKHQQLQNEVTELRNIANLLQNEAAAAQQLSNQQRDQIRHLNDELQACYTMAQSVQQAYETGQLQQ